MMQQIKPGLMSRLPGFLPGARRTGLLVAVAAIAALAAVAAVTPGLFSGPTIQTFLTSIAFVGCVAVGVTFITISGNIMSFSLGATTGASAVMFIAVWNAGGLGLAFLVTLLFGAALSAAQGALIGYLRASPIIVSIASGVLIYGLSAPLTENVAFYANAPQPAWAHAKPFGLPLVFVVFVGVAIVGQIVLSCTAFGRRVYLIGSSFSAARTAGINAPLVILITYAYAGIFGAVAGIMLAVHYHRAAIEFGVGFDYSAITAVLVGGVPIGGGEGSVLRTCLGLLFVGTVEVVLLLHGFRQEWQLLITGIAVLAVIVFGTRGRG
ncbi:MAG: ABC transporter permease [Pseudolabrys sp.]